MARVSLTVKEVTNRNVFAANETFSTITAAVDAADGAEFVMDERDDKYLILVQNSATSAKDVTIKAGNGIQGVNDLTHSVAASSFTFVQVDSGRFKNVSGTDKGKVIIKGASADIKVAVFRLP